MVILPTIIFANWTNENSATLSSDYIWLGQTTSNNEPALMTNFILAHDTGIYTSLSINSPQIKNKYVAEIILSAGYADTLFDDVLDYKFNYAHTSYSGYSNIYFDEIDGTITIDVFDAFDASIWSLYNLNNGVNTASTIGIGRELVKDIDLYLEAGKQYNVNNWYSVKITYSIGEYNIDLMTTHSIMHKTREADNNIHVNITYNF